MNFILFAIFCGLVGAAVNGAPGIQAGLALGLIPAVVHYSFFIVFFFKFVFKVLSSARKNGTTIEQEVEKLKAATKK